MTPRPTVFRHFGYAESTPGIRDGWAYRIDREESAYAGARVLLLGEDNPHSRDPAYALWPAPSGAAGDRLRRILGLTYEDFYALWRANLCTSGWNNAWATLAAGALLRRAAPIAPGIPRPWDVVVCLGRRVSRVCGRMVRAELPTWGILRGARRAPEDEFPAVTMVSLPHPSGLCREWNEVGGVTRARDVLHAAAPHVPWGTTTS